MAYDGWFTFGGVEIVNSARASANTANAGFHTGVVCDPCENLWIPLADPNYSVTRNDPWADPDTPAAAEFFGFQGLEVTGLSKSTITSRVRSKVGDGSAILGTVRQQREIVIRVLATASTQAGLDYGLAWLANLFRGVNGPLCTGETLCFYSECPDCTSLTADACHEKYLRQIYQVSVLDSPTVLTSRGITCDAYFAEVEYTLVAGVPYIYSSPEQLPITFTSTGASLPYPLECVDELECSSTFDCPAPNTIPLRPELTDACAAMRAPSGLFYHHAFVGGINATTASEWFEKVLIIDYQALGAEANLVLHFIPNFVAASCSVLDLDRCNSCVSMHIPIIPDAAKVTIDGRTQTLQSVCERPGNILQRDDLPIYGVGAIGNMDGVFTWPVLECSYSYCVILEVYKNNATLPDLKIYVAERRDVA